MITKLTDEEISFTECLYDTTAMAEIVFSDYDNLTVMDEDTLGHVRLGQIPLLSHEYIIDEDASPTDKEAMSWRKGAGDTYCLGGRLFGKTLFVEKIDLLISMICLGSERVGFSSYDFLHIRGVLEEVIQSLEHHPFFRLYKAEITRSPNFRVALPTGYLLEGVNMNITGKKPGAQFFQKHFSRLYIEEASFETEQVYKQRRDSVSENGCVFRIAGMTNFTKYSPCGAKFYDIKLKVQVINLPQYVNPKWDTKSKEQAIKDFGGEQTIGYRVFIKGEVVEEGVSVFDMERVRKNYDEDKKIKFFEIQKNLFSSFENLIIVERPKNADQTIIFADIGESAPSEIGIIFKVNDRYKYVYNITLYNLTDKEQYKIFKWLTETLEAEVIAIDCSDGTGRAIFRSLQEVFPNENLVWVSFNEKIPVDFEKDPSGKEILIKNGQPVYKEEYTVDWSIKRLKDLLYGYKIDLPLDYKFDMQFNSVIAMQSGMRTIYSCIAQENHLFQAFQVFSIAEWYIEFHLLKPANRKVFFKSGT